MRKYWVLVTGIWCLISIWVLGFGIDPAQAVYDPLSAPNNRSGVHILDVSEIESAAKLVNSNGGQWGYVTIPIRSNDRDPVKWRQFFTRAGQLKIIPIIRLATYPYGDTWATPTAFDLVDFANFLGDMPWPTKNRYIIMFNEPNHSKEWGGPVDPGSYASLLVQAKVIFSIRSSDFFLLTAGLDMSAPTNHTSLDALRFYRLMTTAVPRWADSVDGYSFHAYPNPGFSSLPTSSTRYGISSYTYELRLLPSKPIFITETGHLGQPGFYTTAFTQVWSDPNIVAITPFLLFAGSGDFTRFSLLDSDLQPTASYRDLADLPKTLGSPLLGTIIPPQITPLLPAFPSSPPGPQPLLAKLQDLFSPVPDTQSLRIGLTRITVEIADTDSARSQGLSDRDSLPDNYGLLFIYPNPIRPSFWMYRMRFGLDFVWINQGIVVGLTSNVPPPSATAGNPTIVHPDLVSNWILEVPAGFVSSHGIKVGDAVVLSP